MTSVQREQVRIQLEMARSMRANPEEVPALRMLRKAEPDASGYHTALDGQCYCGRLLGPGELETCAECEVHHG